MMMANIGNSFMVQSAVFVYRTLAYFDVLENEGPPQRIVSFTNEELDRFGIVSALVPLQNRTAAASSHRAEAPAPFPIEIWKMIAKRVDPRTQLSLAGTCKAMRESIDVDNVTRNLFMTFTTYEGQAAFLKMLRGLLYNEGVAMKLSSNASEEAQKFLEESLGVQWEAADLSAAGVATLRRDNSDVAKKLLENVEREKTKWERIDVVIPGGPKIEIGKIRNMVQINPLFYS